MQPFKQNAASPRIAVVSMAVRLPQAPTLEAFWEMLCQGKSGISQVPAGRFQVEPESAARFGGFLDDVAAFDPAFFGIAPREAAVMDPQQRLMLELTWELFERAAIRPDLLKNEQVGVFVGASAADYALLLQQAPRHTAGSHAFTGAARSSIANRLSHYFGFRGPSLVVDTGQSSSLVALHLACESLRTQESTLAVVGGVQLNLLAQSAALAEQFGVLSPDGRCWTFDERANGFVRGEGAGIVLLKPLEQAENDGDPIQAILLGSAVNNDGGTHAYALPSIEAQREVLCTAAARAGVSVDHIQYVEAHGTGTRRGDTIEATALGAAYGQRSPEAALLIGSVKTNIGHLEGAAGIIGCIKAILSVAHRQIPPSLNFQRAPQQLDLAALHLRVVQQLEPWPATVQPARAGVSSFGIGGTNCHVILEEYCTRPARPLTIPLFPFQRHYCWFDREYAPTAEAAMPATPKTQQPMLDLVLHEAAAALGYPDASGLEPTATFRELGFDSLLSLGFCDRIKTASSLHVSATALYDYPTPTILARHLETLSSAPRSTQDAKAATYRLIQDDPIVVVGIGCRFPGGVRSAEALWELVANGVDALSPLPTDRGWTFKQAQTHRGGFIADADSFDAAFFGIHPREALAMDPQQRVLLETTWEAFEHAGINPHTLQGTATSVFIGAMPSEYGPRLAEAPPQSEGYVLTGAAPSVLSGRIAYIFGFEGAALTLDTACSSSLSALHAARSALLNDECKLALAGGISILATPGLFLEFDRQDGLARDGRLKAFAAEADGTVWAEGAGVLILERLSAAQRLGHRIHAVIRGSALNQDGHSNGLTAPNGPSQERVIRQALASAGLDAKEIDVLEAHGTGTRLGDPIEAQAILATYGQAHTAEHPLWLGSLKSNIGHTQAAAGVAGVIKMIMAMRHTILPQTLHAQNASPHIEWNSGTVRLLTTAQAWVPSKSPRRAAISSFGISGTNAHILLEEPPASPEPRNCTTLVQPVWLPFFLSAKTPAALEKQAQNLYNFLDAHPTTSMIDLAYTLATTRVLFECAKVIIADDRSALLAALQAIAAGLKSPSQPYADSEDWRLVDRLAQGYLRRETVDWEHFFKAWDAQPLELPTYPFAHKRFWHDTATTGKHPFLEPGIRLPETTAQCFSGSLDATKLTWLGEHRIGTQTILPGTAFLEAGLFVANELGSGEISEITLETPLPVSVDERTNISFMLDTPNHAGTSTFRLYASSKTSGTDVAWKCHARGTLSSSQSTPPAPMLAWPPVGALPTDLENVYEKLAGAGYVYGATFRTLRAMWTRDAETFAEISLDPAQHAAALTYSLHPALLDAALQAIILRQLETLQPDTLLVPFSFSGVRVYRKSPRTLRVRIRQETRHRFSIEGYDEDGQAVFLLAQSLFRTAGSKHRETQTLPRNSALFSLDWQAIAQPELEEFSAAHFQAQTYGFLGTDPRQLRHVCAASGSATFCYQDFAALHDSLARREDLPALMIVSCIAADGFDHETVGSAVQRALILIQEWIDDPRLHDTKLVFLTRGAIATDASAELSDLTGAAVWGFIRTAQSEYPGRYRVIDIDDLQGSASVLQAALQSLEPQLAVRQSQLLRPQLVQRSVPQVRTTPIWPTDGTVLITGGTGALGALVAHHVVRAYGVRHLILMSRRGRKAPQAAVLAAELTSMGVHVTIAAVDAANQRELAAALADIPAAHPLTAVIHAAGVLDDGTIATLTPQKLERVIRAKIDGARNVHELTRHHKLSACIFFSSIMGIIGGAGQANYAAANAYVDALAHHRKNLGLPALSLAWGWWDQKHGFGGGLSNADRARMSRLGLAPLSAEAGLALLDEALCSNESLLLPLELNASAVKSEAPPLLQPFFRTLQPVQFEADAHVPPEQHLAEALRTMPLKKQEAVLLEVVRNHIAAVLGHEGATEIDPQGELAELGFDSLTTMELSKYLSQATNLSLSSTIAFNHSTPLALTRYLHKELQGIQIM